VGLVGGRRRTFAWTTVTGIGAIVPATGWSDPHRPDSGEAGTHARPDPAHLHPVAAGQPPLTAVPVRAIVRHWGIHPVRVTRLGGDRNVHWIASGPDGQHVLRCYRADRDAAAIAYEFAVIGHLAGKGWPVAEPVGANTCWNGRTFALFPRLPGATSSRARERGPGQERRGDLLARLHNDLSDLAPGQRSGWRRLDEFITVAAEPLIRAAEARLPDPWLRTTFVRHTVKTRRDLADCPTDLPRTVVHGDFVPWNLLWRRGQLTGVIDFDDARWDLRATDVALARRRDRDGVVAGYHRRARLADEELALLAPLWRAYTLMFVADLLRAPVLTPRVHDALGWCARQLDRTRPHPNAPDRERKTMLSAPHGAAVEARPGHLRHVQTGHLRHVQIGAASIPYVLAGGEEFVRAAAGLHPDRWILVSSDEPGLGRIAGRVADRLAALAPVERIPIGVGEAAKSLDTVGEVCARAVDAGATRASVVVAVGGGNVCNVAGLCAALLFRGLRLVQVPTTLIGMSDVVLSLKQGVNFAGVKNGLGTYLAPHLIWADPDALRTLPPREIRAGEAEIIKNALILSPAQIPVLLDLFRSDARYDSRTLSTFIELAIAAKSLVLHKDAKERHSALVLEYGHTVGHALEVLSGGLVGHGQGVALGMLVAARVAHRVGLLDREHVALHGRLVEATGLGLDLPAGLADAVTPERLAAQLGRDNKRGYLRLDGGQIPMVLISAPGVPATTDGLPLFPVDVDLVVDAFGETFTGRRTEQPAERAAAR
jgi:3-dehydroquinate synthase/2-deoxy-scyllo-inosose synthase